MHMQILIKQKWNSDNSRGHNSDENLEKMRHNNPNLDLFMVNACAKFDQIHQFTD